MACITRLTLPASMPARLEATSPPIQGDQHTLKHGVTTNHVLGLECILPSGEAIWLGADMDSGDDTPGLDLRGVLIGSEGMFGVVTRALCPFVA